MSANQAYSAVRPSGEDKWVVGYLQLDVHHGATSVCGGAIWWTQNAYEVKAGVM